MSDLTWDELDVLVDTDTIKLRDVAWAEIKRLRATTHPDPVEAATDALGASTGDLHAADSPAIAATRALATHYRRRRCLHEADTLDGTLAEYDRIAEEHGCAIREIRALRDLEDVAYGMLGRVPESLDEALTRIADALADLSRARKTLGGAS